MEIINYSFGIFKNIPIVIDTTTHIFFLLKYC